MHKTYNNAYIPYYLRLTNTVLVSDKKEIREDVEEWGIRKHRPDESYHLLDEAERKRDRDE